MPAKILTICYVYFCNERIAQHFIVKEITGISRLDDDNLTKVTYLRIKAFISLDSTIKCHIKPFEKGDIIFLKGKFIAHDEYYFISFT